MAESVGGNTAEKVLTAIVSILVAIIGVAALAVIVSKQSNTTGVTSAASGGFAQMLCTALSPIGVTCGSGIPFVTTGITFGGPPGTGFPGPGPGGPQ
jgi:hypothetical protein